METLNKFLVGATASGKIFILNPPDDPISKADALLLAAWLVAISGASEEEFQAQLEVVCST